MIGWIEILLLCVAAALAGCALLARLRAYRPLLFGGGALLLITALIPRPGNGIGAYLFDRSARGLHLSLDFFGVAWWILGAWLVKSVLDLVLRRTLFQNDNQPHARRLFADLASGLVYVIAIVGIIETVLKTPIAGVLATSGVLAIVLGLALQNTLADVFSGLAINIEHPFRAGDWITMNADVEGEVMEINWRATRIRSDSNDTIVIPNSIIAKAIVTNHRRLNDPHVCTLAIQVDYRVGPASVLAALREAAIGCPGVSARGTPSAYACSFSDALVAYQLCYHVDDFVQNATVQSALIGRIVESLARNGIPVGSPATQIRIMPLPERARPGLPSAA